MPLGEPLTETGTVIAYRHGFGLKRDDGGIWELDPCPPLAALKGQRVMFEGRRSAFNALSCERIWRVGTPRPEKRLVRIEFWLAWAIGAISLGALMLLLT